MQKSDGSAGIAEWDPAPKLPLMSPGWGAGCQHNGTPLPAQPAGKSSKQSLAPPGQTANASFSRSSSQLSVEGFCLDMSFFCHRWLAPAEGNVLVPLPSIVLLVPFSGLGTVPECTCFGLSLLRDLCPLCQWESICF